MKTYAVLARTIGARNRCEESNPWKAKWQAHIEQLLEAFPSGSGFDRGTQLCEESTPEKLVFNTAFHHMNEGGFYDGWTEHRVTITPSLEFGYRMRISGRDRNCIKDVIQDYFSQALECEVEQYPQAEAEVAQ